MLSDGQVASPREEVWEGREGTRYLETIMLLGRGVGNEEKYVIPGQEYPWLEPCRMRAGSARLVYLPGWGRTPVTRNVVAGLGQWTRLHV